MDARIRSLITSDISSFLEVMRISGNFMIFGNFRKIPENHEIPVFPLPGPKAGKKTVVPVVSRTRTTGGCHISTDPAIPHYPGTHHPPAAEHVHHRRSHRVSQRLQPVHQASSRYSGPANIPFSRKPPLFNTRKWTPSVLSKSTVLAEKTRV